MGLYAVFVCRSRVCLCRYVLPIVAHSVALCGCVALSPVFVGLRWAVLPCVAVAFVVVYGAMPSPIVRFSARPLVTPRYIFPKFSFLRLYSIFVRICERLSLCVLVLFIHKCSFA